MKPYSEWSCCKKCGAPSFAIATKHTPLFGGRDVIRRTCGRCGFVWDEAPRDASAVTKPHRSDLDVVGHSEMMAP